MFYLGIIIGLVAGFLISEKTNFFTYLKDAVNKSVGEVKEKHENVKVNDPPK